jgi:heme-binding NEAT domain protein
MAKQSKATKTVIASLLATSAIVPAMAVSADTEGTVTTTSAAEKTIDFKVEDASGMLANFVKGPGTLMTVQGKEYIKLNLSDTILNMINEVTVDGKTAVYNYGTKMILIPVSDKYEPVTVDFNITYPGGSGDFQAVLTPDASSIKGDTEEKPAEQEAKPFIAGKDFYAVADGSYDVTVDLYDLKTNLGNYSGMLRHMDTAAKLIVKNGEYSLQIKPKATSNSMIDYLTVNGEKSKVVSGNKTDEVQVFEFPIKSIGGLFEANMHVDASGHVADYPFGIAIETNGLTLPTAAYAYKDGTTDLSIMHNKYLDDEVTVTATETGYDVDLTFPEGQHLLDFTVKGASVALKSEEVVGANTVKIYTVKVDDLSKVYTATADLKVILGETVLYEEAHDFQLKLGSPYVINPFSDIDKDIHKDYILNLYAKGIFKADTKFNPNDSLKRYQFALMLNRALNLDVPATTNFKDIAKLDEESQNAIKALNSYGIINGTSATAFSANDGMKRQHAALMVYRVLVKNGYQPSGATSNFTDLPKDAEAVKAINELNHLGIMTGYNGKVTPDATLTRSQMAKIMNNALTVLEGLK